jgi:hypothetical protein
MFKAIITHTHTHTETHRAMRLEWFAKKSDEYILIHISVPTELERYPLNKLGRKKN